MVRLGAARAGMVLLSLAVVTAACSSAANERKSALTRTAATATTGTLGAAGAVSKAARPGKIVFVRGWNPWVVNPDGTAPTRLRLTVSVRGQDAEAISWSSPSWSRDGKRLALVGYFDNGLMGGDNRIYLRQPNGRTTDVSETGPDTATVDWSPDGKWLVSDSGWDDPGLGIENLTTGEGRNVTKTYRVRGYDAAWSPDGAWIVFRYGTGYADGGFPDWHGLALIRPTGLGLRELTLRNGQEWPNDPDWSPNGKKIAFTDKKGISVVDRDGSPLKRLTTNATDAEPTWSPDGSHIVFTRAGVGDLCDLWIMRSDGTHQVRLIRNGYSPDWQPILKTG